MNEETRAEMQRARVLASGSSMYFDMHGDATVVTCGVSGKFFTWRGFGLHRMAGALKRYTTRINIARLKMRRQEHVRAILDSSKWNCEER